MAFPVRPGRLVGFVAITIFLVLLDGILFEVVTWPQVARLARQAPRTTAFMDEYRSRQRRAGKPDRLEWKWVPGDSISVNLKRAVLVSEDIGFFAHHGFELGEMKDAIKESLLKGAAPRGASTITQQLAKNLWLSPSRNPLRKLKEAVLTRQLESDLSKSRILELYLNVVEFGPAIYGAEAAARHFFDKSASALTEHEAALLASGLSRPSAWNPSKSSQAYGRQVAKVEERMSHATFLWRHLGVLPVMPDSLAAADSTLAEFLKSDSAFRFEMPAGDSMP